MSDVYNNIHYNYFVDYFNWIEFFRTFGEPFSIDLLLTYLSDLLTYLSDFLCSDLFRSNGNLNNFPYLIIYSFFKYHLQNDQSTGDRIFLQ